MRFFIKISEKYHNEISILINSYLSEISSLLTNKMMETLIFISQTNFGLMRYLDKKPNFDWILD